MNDGGHWATLTISLRAGRVEREELTQSRDHMQDMAALLAMEDGVSGVETRGPNSMPPVERAELVVYTEPAHLESLGATTSALAGALGLDVVQRSEVRDDEDWKDAWKAHYRPIVFGDSQLLLRPSWLERRPDDPAIEIVLDPGRAFGTGLHESTALCLDRLCSLSKTKTTTRMLDLGCGSGILALAALRLWPDSIVHAQAVDIDSEAVDTTIENADANGLRERLSTAVGTLDAVGDATFDLVLANIRPEVLVPIAASLREHVVSGGSLILSGILAEEGDEVAAAFEAAGWISSGPQRGKGEWVGLDYEAP